MTTLEIKARDGKKKAAALRAEGSMPAVFYGPKEESTPITVDAKEFEKLWKEEGSASIITLAGIGDEKEALIHAVDQDPVTGSVLHADLYVIERGKKIEIAIPLEFTGEAAAEKQGHVVVKVMHEVTIRVRPSELPQQFDIDITNLTNIGDHITAGDIKLPESAELMIEPTETLVSVTEVQEEKEETPEPEAPAEGEAAPTDTPAE